MMAGLEMGARQYGRVAEAAVQDSRYAKLGKVDLLYGDFSYAGICSSVI